MTPRAVQSLRDEAAVLDELVGTLCADPDELRRQLAAAAEDSGRRWAEVAALDRLRLRTRLYATSLLLIAALLEVAVGLLGGAP